MTMIDKTTQVPDGSMPYERDAEGNLNYFVLAQFGRAALDVGTPDRGENDERTDAVDAIANIMHWLAALEIDPASVLDSAARHFLTETPSQTNETRAVYILKAAGLDAYLEHTGGGIWVAEVRSQTIEGRTVWVTDSDGAEGGPFLVGAYPEPWGDEWIEQLSGPCSAVDLPTQVRRGLDTPGPSSGRTEES